METIKSHELVVVQIDDWEALYVDGKSVLQNHDIEPKDMCNYTPIISLEVYQGCEKLEQYAHDYGYLPKSLDQVVRVCNDKLEVAE